MDLGRPCIKLTGPILADKLLACALPPEQLITVGMVSQRFKLVFISRARTRLVLAEIMEGCAYVRSVTSPGQLPVFG